MVAEQFRDRPFGCGQSLSLKLGLMAAIRLSPAKCT